MKKYLFWTTLAVSMLIAVGGYWQVLRSPVFWCGRIGAFPTIYLLTGAAMLQLALYLSAASSSRHRALYLGSQFLVLPFLLLGLVQVFWPYPVSALYLLIAGLLPLAIARYRGCVWARKAPVAAFGVALITQLGVMAAIVQIPLSAPATLVTNTELMGAVLVGLLAAVLALHHLDRYFGPGPGRPTALPMLPLSLLLLAVLRAKFPDTSYDAYLYKATLPMQMADWRTGDMPIINTMMIGTTFQEMLNAALIMVTGDYLPPLISTVAFGALFAITPCAFSVAADERRKDMAIAAFAAAIAYTLTEGGMEQGTSYQEPLMLLLLVASLLPGRLWPLFLAMAAMVKINAGFLAPLILFAQFQRSRRDVLAWPTLAVIVVSALLVVGPQFQRNLTFSGRLLGQNELLATVTDPPGPHQIMVAGASHFDGTVRGGLLNNGLASACNMLLLNLACPTSYGGSDVAGFHVFPASRAPLFAVLACVVLLALAAMRQAAFGVAAASIALYALAYVLILKFMSEGRFFLPLSFGCAVLLLVNRAALADLLLDDTLVGSRWMAITAVAVFVVGSDLVPGMYTNVSWTCVRSLFAPAQAQTLTTPRTPTEAFLMKLARDYRAHCPPPALPPVILGQHDKLNAPYLGVQQSHYFLTHQMNDRFYAADPSRRLGLAKAVLALAYVDPNTPSQLLGEATKDFTACFSDADYHVLCSKQLAPAGDDCAQSLFPGSNPTARR